MECLICADPVDVLAMLQCSHQFCFRCVLRLRMLLRSKTCPLCSAASEKVLLLGGSHQPGPYEALERDCTHCNEALNLFTNDTTLLTRVNELLESQCRECVPAVGFLSEDALSCHLREQHRLQWCSVCLQHRPQFPAERTLYRCADLDKHLSLDAVCPADPPQLRGHPRCDFCQARHYDAEALYKHLLKAHLQCPVCCREGTPDQYSFFKDRRALGQHCEGRHHFCDAESCKQRVFQTELDLQAHRMQSHGAVKGKRRALTLGELQSSAANVLREVPIHSAAHASSSSSSFVIQFFHGGNRRTVSPNLSAFATDEEQPSWEAPNTRPSTLPLASTAAHSSRPADQPQASLPPPKPKAKPAAERHKLPDEPLPIPNFNATASWPAAELSPEQMDEVEALHAIYEEQLVQDGGRYTVSVPLLMSDGSDDPRGPLQLSFAFPPGYPDQRGPRMQVDATWLDGAQAARLEQELQRQVEGNLGGPMMFALVEWLKEHAAALLPRVPTAPPVGDTAAEPIVPSHLSQVTIQAGEPVTDRKSKFQAFCARVQSLEEVDFVVQTLLANQKIAAAAHPTIVAYRLVDSQGRLQEHRDDDGETGAADKLLYLLQVGDARDVVVVVTRWFGGIHLGADRFRHITNVAKELLQQEGYIGQKGTDSVAPKPKAKTKK
eukprot:GGOE01001226.1.p1 GENE.GGOE01001226.1~~GGOE01001226.1.p1  ORF type:complete len:664 (-),score=186.07 GGOE01001226.1:74-2065(-)